MLISFNTLCIVAALVTAGTLGYMNKKVGEIDRVVLNDSLRPNEDTEAGAPLNYLLVGVDDATGLPPGDPALRGRDDIGGIRSDTIMILRVDPGDTTAHILSLPRDLWVPISGQSGKSRINEAISTGGPSGLINTIRENFGIPIDHYVQVNWASFQELVNAIGGVPIWFPEPVRAKCLGLLVVTTGCHVLDGHSALAFAKAR